MSNVTPDSPMSTNEEPQWKPLSSIDRRVLGVLMEKAKTTPDTYPMSLNALCNGCNQKSNRSPLMHLEPDDVEESLDRLRNVGAVGLIEGLGRVTKYRHYAYQWLGVDKVEFAVIAELLLRGAQTEGELRGRAARMEPISGLSELRPILASLKSKGLVLALTPEGRGHVVTHALYQPAEIEKIRLNFGEAKSDTPPSRTVDDTDHPIASVVTQSHPTSDDTIQSIREELTQMRSEMVELRTQLDELSEAQRRAEDEVRELREALGG